jgi:hypothetical protein
VHHGLDSGLTQDLGNNRVADVCANELHSWQFQFRGHYVNADDLIDCRVFRKDPGQLPT